MSQSLQEALAVFSPSDIEGVQEPKQDELSRPQARQAAAMRFFNSVRHRNDLEQCVAVLAPEDIRAEFQMAFRRFSQSMDMLLSDLHAQESGGDLGWFGKDPSGRQSPLSRRQPDISDCGDKVAAPLTLSERVLIDRTR